MLYDKEEHYTEQYHILKLTSKEMKWRMHRPKTGILTNGLRSTKIN